MKTIVSPDNPTYKMLRSLVSAKGRHEHGLYLAEGPHLLEEALKSGAAIRYAVVSEDMLEHYAAISEASGRAGAETLSLPPKLFKALADTGAPQGILAAAEIKRAALGDMARGDARIAVALDRLQDPGNLGTILRTALAVGAGFAALSKDSADPWSPKVVRASQGAVFHLPVAEADSAAEAIRALNEAGWHTACGYLGGRDFFRRGRHEKTAVVIGNEAAGVSPETAKACSERYMLPMPGRAESLNAAVAAGVMLYDVWREQNQISDS
jgi:TrmH family RNA methyltransferase